MINKFLKKRIFLSSSSNLIIGGISSSINTPTLLAAKMQQYPSQNPYSISDIKDFKINGDNIECNVEKDYIIKSFNFNSDITFFNDIGNRCKVIGTHAFRGCDNMLSISADGVELIKVSAFNNSDGVDSFYFPNCISIETTAFYRCETGYRTIDLPKCTTLSGSGHFFRGYNAELINIPKCVTLGDTVGNDSIFRNLKPGCVINANIFLATNNGGLPDGDLQYAISSRGAIVNYII